MPWKTIKRMRKRKVKVFKAWARKGNGEFITTEIKAATVTEAVKWFKINGYELQGKPYESN